MPSTTKQIIEAETLRAGQPRAYAGRIYEYLITPNWNPEDLEGYIRRLVKATPDHHRPRDNSAESDWWTPYIEEIKRTGENTWKVRTKHDYLD